MPETTILDEGAVSEIEARLKRWTMASGAYPATWNDVSALCATVKHLRWQVDLSEKAFELDGALKLSEVGDLNALQVVRKMVDLQSQLEQLRAENERLTQEREAAKGLLSKNLHGQIEGVFGDQRSVIDRFRSDAIKTCKSRALEWGQLGLSNTWFAGKEEAANELADELEKL